MMVIHFPGAGPSSDARWNADLEAALNGDGQGPVADAWRELRTDVRALAPPLDPALELRLRAEIERRTAPAARRRRARSPRVSRSLLARAAALVVIVLAVAGLGAVIDSHLGSSNRLSSASIAERADRLGTVSPAVVRPDNAPVRPATPAASETARVESLKTPDASAAASGADVPSTATPGSSEAPPAAPGRLQQLSASLSLATGPTSVQAISDAVARLTARDGGFVASSHVQVQQQGGSEATLSLRLPSAHLGSALAAIGRLAAVRSESQSLQDITSSYDSARKQLADATAERTALLRALAKASSEGQIASLRGRLAVNRGLIASDQSQLAAVSRRASDAEVEVTVLGSAQPEGGGLTIRRGLHDAGRILTVALALLVIAAAVLVPLALLFAALALAARRWRRYTREGALADS